MTTCKICGDPEPLPSLRKVPFKDGTCYVCRWWQPYIQSQAGLRYRGVHYTVAGDFEPDKSGMAGHQWEFVMMDRRVLMCRNVTCQGTIPYRLIADLPDNVARLRTTWRGDELPASLGFGNPEPPEVVIQPKPATSLFDLF